MASTGLLQRLGLSLTAFRAEEFLRAADWRVRRKNSRVREAANGDIPLPPERLAVLVAGSPDLGWFVEGGRLAAESIQAAVERQGRRLGAMDAVLDFGCGCGRVLRHLVGNGDVQLCGCDYNVELVNWCRAAMPSGVFRANALTPPLPWRAESFDLIWALSVFTHLSEELQFDWIGELRRVLRPDGLLLLTTQGEHYLELLNQSERQCFERGELVVRHVDAPGTNLCTAFHPIDFLYGPLTEGFQVVEFIPGGAVGNPFQDLVLLKKTRD